MLLTVVSSAALSVVACNNLAGTLHFERIDRSVSARVMTYRYGFGISSLVIRTLCDRGLLLMETTEFLFQSRKLFF